MKLLTDFLLNINELSMPSHGCSDMGLPEVSEAAQQIIRDYVAAVDKKLSELGFVLEDWDRRELLFGVENSIRLFSIALAKRRGSMVVEAVDAKKAVRHASPTMFIKHALGTPEQYQLGRKTREENFKIFKEHLESLDRPRLLDAGCGWGRQIISYRKRGLKGEFFGVDISKASVHYGKTVDPHINFIVADIQHLPFKDQCFDAVICLAVVTQIRHNKGTENSIREFSRVLNSKGLLELADSFTENVLMTKMLNIMTRLFRIFWHEIGHFCHFSRVRELLEENGFTELKAIKLRPTIISLLFGNIYDLLAYKN